jgi:hypothetical protein
MVMLNFDKQNLITIYFRVINKLVEDKWNYSDYSLELLKAISRMSMDDMFKTITTMVVIVDMKYN